MKFIERHHDYVFTVASMAAATQLLSQPLQLDSDAPFALRGRAIYSEGGAALQANTLNLRTRFQDADYHYRASDLLPASIDIPFAGYNGIFSPVRPQILYPAKGTIITDIANPTGNGTLTAIKVIYRGVKAYPAGSVIARTFPGGKVRLFPCSYTQQVTVPASGATATLRQVTMDVKQDSDFILRGAQASTETAAGYTSLNIQLMDENLQPYSNAPIPIDYLFGNSSAKTTGIFQGVQTGNWIPGLIFPEIYIPASHRIVFDLIRNDLEGSTVVLNINWIGCKVVPG